MIEKIYECPCGPIHYWTNELTENRLTLVFLPGLTADHRLFDKQIEFFQDRYNIFVWDAPGHAASRPFELTFDLGDKAEWLHEILVKEDIRYPVLIGQSMGGYVTQMYTEKYPDHIKGAVIIDSAPLQKVYTTSIETYLLKRMEWVYRISPWSFLLQAGTEGVADSEYGRQLMKDMMMVYDGQQEYYAKLSGHGMKMLGAVIDSDPACVFKCPVLLLCGRNDKAGSALRHNKAWHKRTGLPLVFIERAGHNSNTDQPETVNRLIEDFLQKSVMNRGSLHLFEG
ncbi:MAG: alpha/beta hydrolase [Solobacterium sp.]|nr:alpha/beta hydrolase [Solobacterium sp.]